MVHCAGITWYGAKLLTLDISSSNSTSAYGQQDVCCVYTILRDITQICRCERYSCECMQRRCLHIQMNIYIHTCIHAPLSGDATYIDVLEPLAAVPLQAEADAAMDGEDQSRFVQVFGCPWSPTQRFQVSSFVIVGIPLWWSS